MRHFGSDEAALEALVRAALQGSEALPTSECPSIEALAELAESGDTLAEAAILKEHVASCAYCAREYMELVGDLARSDGKTDDGWLADSAPEEASVRLSPPNRLRPFFPLHTGRLAAATTNQDLRWIAFEGAMLLTLFVEGGQAILYAENPHEARWHLDANGGYSHQTGSGLSLAGDLIRFTLTTANQIRRGYFVLPMTEGTSEAEISLGPLSALEEGQLVCELADASDLTDPQEVALSLASATRLSTRQAWRTFAEDHAAELPLRIRADILRAVPDE
jgi:hypothetical protein